jgi:hypothetical protein
MKAFCVSHRAPVIKIPVPFILVSPTHNTEFRNIFIPDDYLGDAFHGRIMSEYLQLFGLADVLRTSISPEKIYIFQYRKFTSYNSPDLVSKNLPWYKVANENQAPKYFPDLNQLEKFDADLMVGPYIRHHGKPIAQAYSLSHLIEDFICFALALREVKEFDQKRCNAFVNSEFLIPAPSLGMVRTDFFIETMDILRATWEIFSKHYYKPREGFQRRVGGFLLERLHSFLIYERYAVQGKGKAVTAANIVVSDSDIVSQTI